MTADAFRKIALALPGAVEKAHMNHPDFRLHDKIFASLGSPDETWGMVKLTPGQQRTFLEQAPAMFKPCAGAWGRQGYTNVRLSAAKPPVLRAAMSAAAGNLDLPSPERKRV